MKWKQPEPVEGGIKIPTSWVFLHYYEAFNLLFRIENALRVFVYIVLKNELHEKWMEAVVPGSEEEKVTIISLAKKRMSQALSFGYLGYKITCPIMHLNSGELSRLILSDSYWKYFKSYFPGSKDIIKNKFDEIGSIRNSLAHFRPLQEDDINVIKQNSKHILLNVEQFLNQALNQNHIVPTNTTDDWYKSLKSLDSDLCKVRLYQSDDEQWIRISLYYQCPVIRTIDDTEILKSYRVLTIKSSAVLRQFPDITQHICYQSEYVFTPGITKDKNVEATKILSFVISKIKIQSHYQIIEKSLSDLTLKITTETECIKLDNLARGDVVYSAFIMTTLEEEKNQLHWNWYYPQLKTPVTEDDPPEYWGDLNLFGWSDIITSTQKYPWMTATISP